MSDTEGAVEQQPAATPALRASPILERIAVRPGALVACVFFALMLLYFNYLPLWHTDLWGFVNYGKWILEHGSLPTQDPFMPLTEGIRVIDSSWLTQVVFGKVESVGGAEGLSNLYAVTQVVVFVALARVFYVQTSRLGLSIWGSGLVFFMAQSRILVIRPEMFGCVCCAVLFWLVAREYGFRSATDGEGDERNGLAEARIRGPIDRAILWIGVPVIFVLWANLHGSFAIGLVILSCCTMGRAVEALWEKRSVRVLFDDPELRRWILLTELALGATLVNPYGVDLLIFTAQFSSNSNMRDVWEWKPYSLLGPGGMHLAVSLVLLLIVFRWSRRRFRPVELLLLGLFGIATLASIRMITWYALVLGYVLVPHLADIADRCRARISPSPWGAALSGLGGFWSTRSWKYGFVSVWVVWVTFAVSGLSRPVLGGNPRPPEHLYHSLTPRGISKYLRENPPPGQIWNPQVLGDWLAWDGPPGMRMFTTTNIHLIPKQVWRDYMYVFDGLPGWERTLDKYHVDTVVIDLELQKTLPRIMRRTPSWRLAYEDEQGLVFVRSKPGLSAAQPGAQTEAGATAAGAADELSASDSARGEP